MLREQAIKTVAQNKVKNLAVKERDEQLEIMTMEVWDDHEAWKNLPKSVQKEFENGVLEYQVDSDRYDSVLFIWAAYELKAVTNEYLFAELKKIGVNESEIDGTPLKMQACPCCGYRTIDIRGDFDICRVCWWEDDGQDNNNAGASYGGPNGISLSQARYNFIQYGIYDPSRSDLYKIRDPKEKYAIGRVFALKENILSEIESSWQVNMKKIGPTKKGYS